MPAFLLFPTELFEEVELVLHLADELACGGAILLIRMVGGAPPTLLRLGAVVRVVGGGFFAARDEGGGELSLCGEGAEDFAVRTEKVGGACERGDGVLGADICAVRLEEDDARTVDLGRNAFIRSSGPPRRSQ